MKNKKNISTENHAGPKPVNPGSPSNSYTLYDTCAKCPLSAYIDMVCNDNLRALVVSGNPPEEVLQQTRMNLTSEFHELSGNTDSQALNTTLRHIYLHKAQILGFIICAQLLADGKKDEAREFLGRNGMPVKNIPNDEKGLSALVKKIESQIKIRKVRLKQDISRYNTIMARTSGGGGKASFALFNDQLVALSKHAGFRIPLSITLAEYAGYLKDFKNTMNYAPNHK